MYSVYTKLCVSLGPSAQGWRPKVLNFKDTHLKNIYIRIKITTIYLAKKHSKMEQYHSQYT